METPRDNTNGIPVVDSGIPKTPEEQGMIPSPFPYLNPDSDEWKGADDKGFDTDGGIAVLDPNRDPDDFGGDEAEEDDEDEGNDDDSDTGFGFGIGLLSTFFMPPRFA